MAGKSEKIIPHPDPKIAEDIARLHKLCQSKIVYIVECPVCSGRQCWWCEGKGFCAYIFRPSWIPESKWKVIAEIPRDKYDIDYFEHIKNIDEIKEKFQEYLK